MQQCSVPPAAETQHGQLLHRPSRLFFLRPELPQIKFPAWEAGMAKKALRSQRAAFPLSLSASGLPKLHAEGTYPTLPLLL